jgi:V/A-type H+-transporting ATPase subunit C
VIISAARNIVSSSGRASSYIPGAFFKSRSALDIQKVYNSATAGELLGSLERTKYYQTAKKMFDADGNFNLLNFEIAMLEYYATAAKELGKNFSADSRKDFYELIDLEIDTFNISYIFRQQKLGVSNERIISNIITTHGTIPRRKLMELINAGSDITFTELLGKTKVGKNFSSDDFSYIEGVFERNVYKINKHYLRFSTNPDISVITFISLATTEIDNITHIVEGKRYDMPNDEIQKFLVGVE